MKGKKLLALVLCLLLTISLLPVSALAEGDGEDFTEPDSAALTGEEGDDEEKDDGADNAAPEDMKKQQDASSLRTATSDGYYLVGTINGWGDFLNGSNPGQYMLSLNTLAQGEEYMITLNFPANAQFKIVYVENNAIKYWYGSNYSDYSINNTEEGWYTVYFSDWSLYSETDGNANIGAYYNYSITTVSNGNGSVSASHVRASTGTTITLTITPDAGYELDTLTILNLRNGYSWTQTANTFSMTDGDAQVTATFRLATAHTIAEGSSAVTHGHAVVKNAANETVTQAIAGEVLHIEVDDLESGYIAAYYSVRTQQYGGGEIVSNRPIEQTFEMPGQNAWFSVVYYPSQSGYYWENRSYPVAPTAGNALNPLHILEADGDLYTAVGTVSSTYLYVCQYDASTKTVVQTWSLTVSGSGDARITFDPNASSNNITIARPHTIILRPSLYAPGASIPHVMTEEEKAAAIQTLTVVPEQAYTGDTVTMTLIPKPGYFIKDDNYGTYTKIAEYTYEYVVQDFNSVNIILSIALATGLDEGYYVQIDDAEQSAWLKLVNGTPFYGGVTTVWSKKASLTAGQQLTAWYVSNPGADPVQKTTLSVGASGTQTVYYVAEGTGELHVSNLTGYYLVHANVTSTRPYGITENEAFTAQPGGYYTYDGVFKGEHWVEVAEYEEGTVVQLYIGTKTSVIEVPRDDEGVNGFPYNDALPGRAYFYPDGSGTNCNIKEGVLHIGRLTAYNIALNASSEECEVSGLPTSAYAGDTVTFTVEVFDRDDFKYQIDEVKAEDGDGNDVDVTESDGVWSFTMPASDVTVTVTIRERVSHPVTLEDEDLITRGTVEIKTKCPNGNSFSYPGDTVTVKLTPEQGYQVGHFSVRRNGFPLEETLPVTGPDEQGRYTFVMPDDAVFIRVTFMVPDGYYLVKIPAGGSIDDVLDVYENGLTAFENDSYVFILKENLEADDEEYMLTGVTLTEGDMLWVVKVKDGVIKNWDGGDRPEDDDSYMYQVDANHANADTDPMIAIEIYFRPETPDPDQHPGWAAFGDHLFIAIARDIHVTPADSEAFVSFITPSEPKAVYTATVHFRVTPADGYRILSGPTVTYGDNGSAEVTYDPNNDEYTFTMPDCEVNLLVQFCLEDGYYLNGTMNNWDVASITPAMKFQENAGVDGEYKLSWVFGAATDEFKVVHLVDGQIAAWYGTKKEGHKGDGNEEQAYNYRINDQTGARTVYFRPVWNDAWSGHIWIGEDVVPHAFLMESSASFNDSIKMNFYVDYSAAAGNLPEGVQAVLTCNGNTVKFPVANTPYVPGKGYKISYDLVAKQVEDVVNIKLVDANDQPFLFTSKKGTRDYTVNGKDLTLREYLDYMLTLPDWSDLGQAAMDYCYAAKQRFKHGWTEGLYSFSTAVGNVTISDLDQYAPIKIGTMPTGVSTDQITAMFESDNSFRMYLKYNEANTEGNYTYAVDAVTSVDDPTLLKWSDDYQKYYLTFTGVYSNKLQEFHSITVSDENGSYTYNACVLTYARSVLKYSSESDMITLVQALYLYNQAAVDKFKEQH